MHLSITSLQINPFTYTTRIKKKSVWVLKENRCYQILVDLPPPGPGALVLPALLPRNMGQKFVPGQPKCTFHSLFFLLPWLSLIHYLPRWHINQIFTDLFQTLQFSWKAFAHHLTLPQKCYQWFLVLWNLRNNSGLLFAHQHELLWKLLSFKVQEIISGHKLKAYVFISDLN